MPVVVSVSFVRPNTRDITPAQRKVIADDIGKRVSAKVMAEFVKEDEATAWKETQEMFFKMDIAFHKEKNGNNSKRD